MSFRSFRNKHFARKGFSLIELLVVVFIIITLSLVVASKYPEAIRIYSVKNVSENITLLIKDAQQYNVSAKEFSGTFNNRYGIYFDFSVSPPQVKFFVDKDTGTKWAYDAGDDVSDPTMAARASALASLLNDPLILQAVTQGTVAATAYLAPNSANASCAGGGSSTYVMKKFSILFQRPNLAPIISDQTNNRLYPSSSYRPICRFDIALPGKTVRIFSTGAIEVL